MPKSAYFGVMSTGHGCFPPKPNIQCSSNVFVNGKGVVRVGDAWAIHSCPNNGSHGSTSSKGSPNVFANGKARVRIDDSLSDTDAVAEGSSNVYVNG
jgi:uncharacterized Zn-binding protein involved in type VI secretion